MQASTKLKIAALVLLVASISAFAFITYRPEMGSPVTWTTGDNDPVLSFYPCPGGLYLVASGNVSFVNATGCALWETPFAGAQFSVLGEDGRLYVYSRNEGLVSFDHSGNQAFLGKYDVNHPLSADSNGTVYFRSWNELAAVSSGGALWSEAVAITDPVLDGDDNVYYLVRKASRISDTFLVSRSPDGRQRWSLLLDRYYQDTSLMPADHGVYVSGSMEGDLIRIDGDGNITWTYSRPYLGEYQPVIDRTGHIYLVYQSDTVHVLSPDGSMFSKYLLEDAYGVNETGQPAACNGTLYTAGPGQCPDSAIIYATSLDGSVRWQASFNSTGPSQIYASDGLVVTATELQRTGEVAPVLYVYDDSGHLLYNFYSGDGRAWDQVTIVDNVIYAQTFGGRLYALKGL